MNSIIGSILLFFSGSFAVKSPSVVPIAWNNFVPSVGTDSNSIKQKQLLQGFNKFTLTTWWNSKWGSAIPQYLPIINSEGSASDAADHMIGLAVALKMGIYDSSKTGISRAEAIEKCRWAISSIAKAHLANTSGGWGHGWQSCFWAGNAAAAGWFIWDQFSAVDQEFIRKMIENEADYIANISVPNFRNANGDVQSSGDTKFEENGWNTIGLGVAAAMMPNHERQEIWLCALMDYGVSAQAMNSDCNSNKNINGMAVGDWIRGSNILDDGFMVNHGSINSGYVTCYAQNNQSIIWLTLAGLAAPKGLTLNQDHIYHALTDVQFVPGQTHEYTNVANYKPGGTMYKYPGGSLWSSILYEPNGSDWGNNMYMLPWGDAWANTLGLDSLSTIKAEYWERLHCDGFLKMQSRFTDGHAYTSGENGYCCMGGESAWTSGVACMAKWLKVNWNHLNLTNDNLGSKLHGTAILGCDLAQTDDGGYSSGQMYLTRFTATKSFTAIGMSLSAFSGGTGKLSCSIYADKNGTVGNLLASTNEISDPSAGWVDLSLASTIDIESGSRYWLGYWSNATGFKARHGKAGGLGSGEGLFKSQSYGAWPTMLSGVTGKQSRASIYAWGKGGVPLEVQSKKIEIGNRNIIHKINMRIGKGPGLSFSAQGAFTLKVVDISGRIVWARSSDQDANYSIENNFGRSGIFTLVIKDSQGISTRSVFVN